MLNDRFIKLGFVNRDCGIWFLLFVGSCGEEAESESVAGSGRRRKVGSGSIHTGIGEARSGMAWEIGGAWLGRRAGGIRIGRMEEARRTDLDRVPWCNDNLIYVVAKIALLGYDCDFGD